MFITDITIGNTHSNKNNSTIGSYFYWQIVLFRSELITRLSVKSKLDGAKLAGIPITRKIGRFVYSGQLFSLLIKTFSGDTASR